MPAAEGVRLEGLRELTRAFKKADRTLAAELRVGLHAAAEPVRADAERLAVEAIPRIGVPWSRMRVGVTTREVYVAPRQRGSRIPHRRRPNLAALLLGRSMVPALNDNRQAVIRGVDAVLGSVGRAWES